MKKFLIALSTALLLCSTAVPAFADQYTTVVTDSVTLGKGTAELPLIDGSNDTAAETLANELIKTTAQNLLKNGGTLDYKITLNRPSLLSLVMTVTNNGQISCQGLNIDLTSGREFAVTDFFMDNDHMKTLVPDYSNVLFGEEGLYLRDAQGGSYDKLVPYSTLQGDMRIGNAARILQIAKITGKSAGKTLVLDAPGLVALKLDSNPSTGYGWELGSKNANVRLVGKSFNMPSSNDNRVGTPGEEIIFLTIDAPGTYDVRMDYKRSWERMAVKNMTFKVVVK